MKLIPMNELNERGIPYSRAHLYRLIQREEVPCAIRLGENRIAFVEARNRCLAQAQGR